MAWNKVVIMGLASTSTIPLLSKVYALGPFLSFFQITWEF
jgi:hypothetical protein